MNGLDIAETINTWVEKKLNLPFRLFIDLIAQEGEDAGCLRHDPAPAAEKRFLDGSRLVKWNLTYYIRCSHAEKAREYAYRITNTVDGALLQATDNHHPVEIKLKATTLPQFIGKDAKNYTTYSAAITGMYLITP